MNRVSFARWVMDEVVNDTGEAGGGAAGEADLNVDIAAASEQIGNELGLDDTQDKGTDLENKGGAAKPKDESALSPSAKDKPALPADKAAAEVKARVEKAGKLAVAKAELTAKKTDFTGKTDDEILALAAPAAPTAPKSWKKELHEHFGKLPAEVQAYISQREQQVEEGFKANAAKVTYAETLAAAFQPYEALLTAQGVKDHTFAVKTLMNSHYVLSSDTPEGKAKFAAQLMKNYGVDLALLTAAVTAAGTQAAEPPEVRDLRLRTEKLENDRRTELSGRLSAVKAQSAAEVEAFASDPKHPYFNEVAKEMALLLQDPNISMEAAYESAVWANSVTRAKETARLSTEAEAKAREAADTAAKAAEKARGTRVRGNEDHRDSPDLLGTMEDTMRKTLADIKSRQE